MKSLILFALLVAFLAGCSEERTNAKGGSNYAGDECKDSPGACVKTK